MIRSVNDSSTFVEHKTLLWGAFLVGTVFGFLCVYLVAAHPMLTQLEEMRGQMASLQSDM